MAKDVTVSYFEPRDVTAPLAPMVSMVGDEYVLPAFPPAYPAGSENVVNVTRGHDFVVVSMRINGELLVVNVGI